MPSKSQASIGLNGSPMDEAGNERGPHTDNPNGQEASRQAVSGTAAEAPGAPAGGQRCAYILRGKVRCSELTSLAGRILVTYDLPYVWGKSDTQEVAVSATGEFAASLDPLLYQTTLAPSLRSDRLRLTVDIPNAQQAVERVSLADFSRASIVNDRETRQIDITIDVLAASVIVGRVHGGGSEPLQNVLVVAISEYSQDRETVEIARTVTTTNGDFSLRVPISSAVPRLLLLLEGYCARTVNVQGAGQARIDVGTINVGRGDSVSGVVRSQLSDAVRVVATLERLSSEEFVDIRGWSGGVVIAGGEAVAYAASSPVVHGQFVLTGLARRRYSVWLEGAGGGLCRLGQPERPIVVPPAHGLELASSQGNIRFIVVDGDESISGARVSPLANGTPVGVCVTGGDGTVTWCVPPFIRTEYLVESDEREPQTAAIFGPAPGLEVNWTIQLSKKPQPGRLPVTVREKETGHPVTRVRIEVAEELQSGAFSVVRSVVLAEKSGNYLLESLPDRIVRITISPAGPWNGYDSALCPLTTVTRPEKGRQEPLLVYLEAGGVIDCTVTSEAPSLVGKLIVIVDQHGKEHETAALNSDDSTAMHYWSTVPPYRRFMLYPSLPEGPYSVIVRGADGGIARTAEVRIVAGKRNRLSL